MTFKKRNYTVHNLPTFRLGLNNQQSPDEIRDEELADVENFSVEEDSISTAPGYSRWDNDIENHVGPYWGGVMVKDEFGEFYTNVRQRQGILEFNNDDADGMGWEACTLPTTGSPATTITLSEIPCVFAQLNNIVLWTNGTDTVMSSSDYGITWELQADLPICKVIFENAKNRVIFLGQTDNPYRIDWSAINDPLTIGADSFQLLDPNNHGAVIGAGLTPEGMTLIFKEAALYSISDYVDDGIIDMNFIGMTKLTCHQTIQTTRDSVIWYGWDGFSEYIGGTIRSLSGKISPMVRNDVFAMSLMCSAYYNNKYHCSMPDADVSQDYNCQEYIIYKNLMRNDPIQPYVITRNKRYFGCYWIEDAVFDYGRDITLYVGDSRTESDLVTSGSPAVRETPIFAWVNDYRMQTSEDFDLYLGLDGEKQSAFFITKFFSENVPFYVKKYKKLFLNCKFYDSADVNIGYRFDPFAEFAMVKIPIETAQIPWLLEDGNTGNFSEGYGFSQNSIANLFLDIENTEKPRGIQFKVMTDEIKDITNFGMAYKFQTKSGKFK